MIAPNDGQPAAPRVVARVMIVLLDDGSVRANYEGPGRNCFNMMMARAEQDLVPTLIAQEQQKVKAPPPGFSLSKLAN